MPPDGLEIFFYSRWLDLPGTDRGADLYAVTRASTSDPRSALVKLGPTPTAAPSLRWSFIALYFGSTAATGGYSKTMRERLWDTQASPEV